MKNSISIFEALVGFEKYVELIKLPTTTDELVLLRSREFPDYAFAVWSLERRGTRTQMVFKQPSCPHAQKSEKEDRWAVMCACCQSEIRGVSGEQLVPPNDTQGTTKAEQDAAYVKWRRTVGRPFAMTLIQACHAHGITKLFLRHAEGWAEYYDCYFEVEAIEACDFFQYLEQRYDADRVGRAFDFIDFKRSSDLFR